MGEEGYMAFHWNNHNAIFMKILSLLREQQEFTDVSLACDGRLYPAHKFVLSACSGFLKDIFSKNLCSHPVVFMNNTSCKDIEAMLDFMYKGEANVAEEDLMSFVRMADSLQVKGLAVPDDDVFGTNELHDSESGNSKKRRKPAKESESGKQKSVQSKRKRTKDTQNMDDRSILSLNALLTESYYDEQNDDSNNESRKKKSCFKSPEANQEDTREKISDCVFDLEVENNLQDKLEMDQVTHHSDLPQNAPDVILSSNNSKIEKSDHRSVLPQNSDDKNDDVLLLSPNDSEMIQNYHGSDSPNNTPHKNILSKSNTNNVQKSCQMDLSQRSSNKDNDMLILSPKSDSELVKDFNRSDLPQNPSDVLLLSSINSEIVNKSYQTVLQNTVDDDNDQSYLQNTVDDNEVLLLSSESDSDSPSNANYSPNQSDLKKSTSYSSSNKEDHNNDIESSSLKQTKHVPKSYSSIRNFTNHFQTEELAIQLDAPLSPLNTDDILTILSPKPLHNSNIHNNNNYLSQIEKSSSKPSNENSTEEFRILSSHSKSSQDSIANQSSRTNVSDNSEIEECSPIKKPEKPVTENKVVANYNEPSPSLLVSLCDLTEDKNDIKLSDEPSTSVAKGHKASKIKDPNKDKVIRPRKRSLIPCCGENSSNNINAFGAPPKPFVCLLCGSCFNYRKCFTNHFRSHTGDAPVKCQFCGQCFTRKHSLKLHEQLHTGEVPFECDICGKQLRSKHKKTEHMRFKHRVDNST